MFVALSKLDVFVVYCIFSLHQSLRLHTPASSISGGCYVLVMNSIFSYRDRFLKDSIFLYHFVLLFRLRTFVYHSDIRFF